ncbi:MAG: GPW/gp25 family protein [Synergistaceae bacterium]|nr:GPW/gp25 family protein [Synergistaceae bacterium]
MMEYDLMIMPSRVNFAPKSEAEEVIQNVITVCSTMKYSVPMDRDLGVDAVMLDEPVGRARAKLKAEIVRAVKKYEPRARVTRIDFSADLNGTVRPRIRIRVISGEGL